jgi:hypothetical protein
LAQAKEKLKETKNTETGTIDQEGDRKRFDASKRERD